MTGEALRARVLAEYPEDVWFLGRCDIKETPTELVAYVTASTKETVMRARFTQSRATGKITHKAETAWQAARGKTTIF